MSTCRLDLACSAARGRLDRSSLTRHYRAVRIGGSPADMGWESQAVHLVTAATSRHPERDILGLLA